MFKYFISYRWYGDQDSSGVGMIEITRKSKITSMADIEEICEAIKESRRQKAHSIATGQLVNLIIILHWQPFEIHPMVHVGRRGDE